MKRLRLLRMALLALLLPFVVTLALMFRPRPGLHSPPPSGGGPARAEFFEIKEFAEGQLSFSIQAERFQQGEKGDFHVEEVRRLEVAREGRGPLVIRAQRGHVTGGAGQHLIRLEERVEVEDEEEGLRLTIPAVVVNEAAGEARSVGAVSLAAAEYEGEAVSVVYGLDDRPSLLVEPRIRSGEDTLEAELARLLDGTRDVELEGEVALEHGGHRFRSGRLRAKRDREGRLRSITANEGLTGSATGPDAAISAVRAERAHIEWDDQGRAVRLDLEGDAVVRRGDSAVEADRVEARRATGEDRWTVTAFGRVRVTSSDVASPSVLTAAEVVARARGGGGLRSAEAVGNVRFHSGTTAGEAHRATYEAGESESQVVLYAAPGRRARLLQDRSQITAQRIVTDPKGEKLVAEGRVEAVLLPSGERVGGEGGLFRTDEAIHFVAARLEGVPLDGALVFSGAVRGWQGERNLAAERVEMDEEHGRLKATGRVTTRIPRTQAGSVTEADYIQVSASALDYQGAEHRAIYSDQVQVRQAEGWLRADEVQVDLAAEGGDLRALRASGDVSFEYRAPDRSGKPAPVTGTGDRLTYFPEEDIVIVYGDLSPASVHRPGEGGGTSTGRVLRYRMDTGALRVESGDRDRARIRTSGEP